MNPIVILEAAEVAGEAVEGAEAAGAAAEGAEAAEGAGKIPMAPESPGKATMNKAPGTNPIDEQHENAQNAGGDKGNKHGSSGSNAGSSGPGAGTGTSGGNGPISDQLETIIGQLGEQISLQYTQIEIARDAANKHSGAGTKTPTPPRAPKPWTGGAGTIGALAGHARNIIGNQYAGAAASAARGTGKVLSKLGVTGAETVGKTAGALIEAFTMITNAIKQRANELQGYSGALAVSNAQINIQNIMADIREAQALGPGMAKVNNAANDIWIEIRDALLPLKKFLLEVLGNFLVEDVKPAIIWLRDNLTGMLIRVQELPDLIANAMKPWGKDSSEKLKEIQQRIDKAIDAFKKKEPSDLDSLYDKVNRNIILPEAQTNNAAAPYNFQVPVFVN